MEGARPIMPALFIGELKLGRSTSDLSAGKTCK